MEATSRLLPHQRFAAQVLYDNGHGVCEIARYFDCTKKTIAKWLRRASVDDLPHKRGKRALSDAQVAQLVLEVKDKRHRSVRVMSKKFAAQGISASRETIRRYLRKEGLRPFHRPARPVLTPAAKVKRLAFARKYAGQDWNTAVFVDEKCFQLTTVVNSKNDVCWSLTASDVPPRQTQKWPVFIKVFMGMSRKRVTKPVFYTGKMTALDYQRFLGDSELLLRRGTFLAGGNYLLVQDGDTAHTAAATVDFLEHNDIRFITKADWPPNSPDFNPQESLWSNLAWFVDKEEPTTLEELKAAIRKAASLVTRTTLANLVDSTAARLAYAVRTSGGYNKKY